MMATECHWSYDLLKQVAIEEVPNNSRSLEELKNIFSADIDSPRRRDCIRSINELIDVLERRDAISETNIEPFQIMMKGYNCPGLQEALRNYKIPLQVNTCVNQYRESRLAENLKNQLHVNGSTEFRQAEECLGTHKNTQYPTALSEKKREAIHKKIAKELGSYWRSFGRELHVREGEMDEIEVQFPRDLGSRVYKLFEIFERDECNDPKQYVLSICRALDNCKRKDLRRDVENIMSH